ncbi:phosphate acyltransferase PlsX [bacterium]|nr:phosphate acyltransferase PlsX [bacterium]
MSAAKPVIAVDAMGGDHGPSVVVPGAIAALTPDSPFELALYGDPAAIEAALDQAGAAGLPVSVVPCTQDIEMGEAPASAIRNKKDSPIVRAMADQKAGQVQAVVSAGSTGAMVAASLIILGRVAGVDRPAIATLIPTVRGHLVLLDAGANTQCTAEHLVCFARMGDVFVRQMFAVEAPAVGLLNIGSEPKKGPELYVETHALLADSGLNFVGNIEGNDFMLGPCDVVVADGFMGNNALKMVEGFARFMGALARRPDLPADVQAGLRPVLGFLQRDFSYEKYGGALLLGVQGISVIAHGRSSALAITNAVKVGWDMVRNDVLDRMASLEA